MVGVAKWLRQWVVVPSCAGSNPVAHPYILKKQIFFNFLVAKLL